MPWFQRQSTITEAIQHGDLDRALQVFWQQQPPVSRPDLDRERQQLTAALARRASEAVATGNLEAAWRDLSSAADLASPADRDPVSRQTSQLVELTIETAESLLGAGKVRHALQMISQLSDRRVADWRADRIREVADRIQAAGDAASAGNFDQAIEQLEGARQLNPELNFLPGRIAGQQQSADRVKGLAKQLQSAALDCHWERVSQFCDQLLKLAPQHEMALAAKKHALQRMKQKTSVGSRKTSVPERKLTADDFFQLDRKLDGSFESVTSRTPAVARESGVDAPAAREGTFLVWIDGVGGYLVCPDPVNLIGQAKEGSPASITLQADLRRRHARIELIAGQHLVQPLGPVTKNGKPQESAFVLGNGQLLGLGGGVRMKYSQPHPLSKSARLDFASRHRTHPWSDGILLASQTLVFGPDPRSHVHCPHWQADLILFQRGSTWFCRCPLPMHVDGGPAVKEAEITFSSQITGEDFSLTLEPVQATPGDLT